MTIENVTDKWIEEMRITPKRVDSLSHKHTFRNDCDHDTYTLTDDDGNEFVLYIKQNTKLGMHNSFSCGLKYCFEGNTEFTLTRYNGPNHVHSNKLEKKKLCYVCHIHRASKYYLDGTGKEAGFAEATDRFKTLTEAIDCLTIDCNIHGLPAQRRLF